MEQFESDTDESDASLSDVDVDDARRSSRKRKRKRKRGRNHEDGFNAPTRSGRAGHSKSTNEDTRSDELSSEASCESVDITPATKRRRGRAAGEGVVAHPMALAAMDGRNPASNPSGGPPGGWGQFFGTTGATRSPVDPFSGSLRPDAFALKRKQMFTTPDAYRGVSEQVSDTIETLSWLADSFYTHPTEGIAPMTLTDSMHIEWNTWEFPSTFVPRVPELGTVRLTSSRFQSATASFHRRGLGARFEHGWLDTPKGRVHFAQTIAQITRSFLETNYFGVIHALNTAKDSAQRFRREANMWGLSGENMYEEWKLDTWDYLKNEKQGLYRLDTKIKEIVKTYPNVDPMDTWLMHPEVAAHMAFRPEYTTAMIGGAERVTQHLEDGVNSFTSFRPGENIHFVRMFTVDQEGPRHPLVRHTQIGEMYMMNDPGRGTNRAGYETRERHIQVYDEHDDDMHEFTVVDAINNDQAFRDTDGKPHPEGEPMPLHEKMKTSSLTGNTEVGSAADMGKRFVVERNKMDLVSGLIDRPSSGTVDIVRRIGDIPMTEECFSLNDVLSTARIMCDKCDESVLGNVDRRVGSVAAWRDFAGALRRGGHNSDRAYIDRWVDRYAAAFNNMVLIGADAGTLVMADHPVDVVTNNRKYRFERDIDDDANHLCVPNFKGVFSANVAAGAGAGHTAMTANNRIFGADDAAMNEIPLGAVSWGALGHLAADFGSIVNAPADMRAVHAFVDSLESVVMHAGEAFAGSLTAHGALSGAWNARTSVPEAMAGGTVQGRATADASITTDLESNIACLLENTINRRMLPLAYSHDAVFDHAAAAGIVVTGLLVTEEQAIEIGHRENGDRWAVYRPLTDGSTLTQYMQCGAAPAPPDAAHTAAQAMLRLYYKSAFRSASADPMTPMLGSCVHPTLSILNAVNDVNAAVDYTPFNASAANIVYGNRFIERETFVQNRTLPDADPQNTNVIVNGANVAVNVGFQVASTLVHDLIGKRYNACVNAMGVVRNVQQLYKNRPHAIADPETVLAIAYEGIAFNGKMLKILAANDIPIPCGWMVVKPHMRYTTLSCMKLHKGRKTATTWTRKGRAEFGDDIQTQQQGLTVTQYSRTVVAKPQNVFVLDDSFVGGYEGGCGSEPYAPAGGYAPNKNKYGGQDGGDGSVVFILLPYGVACTTKTRRIDITGVFAMPTARKKVDGMGTSPKAHYPTAGFYRSRWKWVSRTFAADNFNRSEYVSDRRPANTICWIGHHRHWDPYAKTFDNQSYWTRGKGHWKDDARPGVASIRNGSRSGDTRVVQVNA